MIINCIKHIKDVLKTYLILLFNNEATFYRTYNNKNNTLFSTTGITIATMEWLIGSFSFVSKRSPKALLSHKNLAAETKT